MINSLSVSENELAACEADKLCYLAEKHRNEFFIFKRGQKIIIDENKFHCISDDKNIIFEVHGKLRWFLKFSLTKEWVQHEIVGAESVKKTLGKFDGYQHANVIRASIANKYTLYSSVDGTIFNAMLINECIIGAVKFPNSIVPIMQNLGRCFGRLHSYNDSPEIKALNPSTLSYIHCYLDELKESNTIVDKIALWVEMQPIMAESTGWIHGNIKSEDILISNHKVTLLDFGTCGIGEPYEDLINICTYMLLLQTVPLFPWRVARHAMSALFDGYAKEYHYDRSILIRYLTQGIFRYYIKNVVMENGVASLSRMPVLRSRIDGLVLQLLDKNYKSAFEGVEL